MIKHLILATRAAVADGNWYAALALALTIPDICARIETPNVGSNKRFARWWNENLTPTYTRSVCGRPHVFLHAEDAYALRCAFLHEGRADIDEQRSQKVLSSFRFVAPSPKTSVHCNHVNDVLQLQVDTFCEDVCQAAEVWADALPEEQDYPPLLEIEIIDPERGFWL